MARRDAIHNPVKNPLIKACPELADRSFDHERGKRRKRLTQERLGKLIAQEAQRVIQARW